jgi:hypothetical protein
MWDVKTSERLANPQNLGKFYKWQRRNFTMRVIFTGMPGGRIFFAFFFISWVAQAGQT